MRTIIRVVGKLITLDDLHILDENEDIGEDEDEKDSNDEEEEEEDSYQENEDK